MTAPIAAIGAGTNECGVMAYPTRSAAKRAEREARKTGSSHRAPVECADCGRWHLERAPRLGNRLPAQSAKRKIEQRERTKMLRQTYGTSPLCARCPNYADDGHELLSRGRGGSITDPANVVPLCRTCHTWVTRNPTAAAAEGWALSRGVA